MESHEKKTPFYKEQNKEKVKEYLEKIENIPQESINYVDESGIQGFLHREYAYAPRGEKVYDSVSGKKYKRTNIVAAKRGKEIIAPWQYDCSMNGMLFEEWFAQKLIPELSEHSVIVIPLERQNNLKDLKSSRNSIIQRIVIMNMHSEPVLQGMPEIFNRIQFG